MSKIIKASCVINKTSLFLNPAPAHLGVHHEANLNKEIPASARHDELTQEQADLIFIETKQMMEELVAQAKGKAEKILADARTEAEAIISKAYQECEAVTNAAYQEGLQAGQQQIIQAEQELRLQYKDVSDIILALKEQKRNYLQTQEKEIIELIFTLTERILGTILEAKPEIVHYIIKRTLEEVKESEKLTIKVNPVHIPYLSAYHDEYSEIYSGHITILEDANLQPGDCMVQTDTGFLDSRLEEQMSILKKGLLEVAGHHGI